MENPLKGLDPKQKKVLAVVAVGAGAYIAWRWFQTGTASGESAVTSGVDAETAGTGVIGSNVGGSENVGNSGSVAEGVIASNDKWFAEAVDRLSNAGWSGTAVQSALGDFLTGQALNSDEAKIVRAAVGAMGGYPPQGPTTIKEAAGSAPSDESKLKAPTGLKVLSKTSNSVTLAWTAVTGAKSYRVYRKGVIENVGASEDTKIVVGGLQPGTSYTFYVAAGLDGWKAGPRSAGLTVKTDTKKLEAPRNLKVSNIGKTSAFLRWDATYPGQYLVRRSGSSQTWESVDNAFAITGLKPKTKYSYQVCAVQDAGRTPGPWSRYVTFTTKR